MKYSRLVTIFSTLFLLSACGVVDFPTPVGLTVQHTGEGEGTHSFKHPENWAVVTNGKDENGVFNYQFKFTGAKPIMIPAPQRPIWEKTECRLSKFDDDFDGEVAQSLIKVMTLGLAIKTIGAIPGEYTWRDADENADLGALVTGESLFTAKGRNTITQNGIVIRQETVDIPTMVFGSLLREADGTYLVYCFGHERFLNQFEALTDRISGTVFEAT